MAETMLVTQALDERDLLVKKIRGKIEKIRLVDTKKRNAEKTAGGRVPVGEFSAEAASAYQQVMDLVDRYQRVDAAIVASNAATWVETSYGRYTVAGTIALRSRLKGGGVYADEGADFERMLAVQMERQYQAAVQAAEAKNKGMRPRRKL